MTLLRGVIKTSTRLRGKHAGVAVAILAAFAYPAAQDERPLQPLPADGRFVSPFFDGWYANSDGTFTLSFGYFNRNHEEIIEIPRGPDNFIVPSDYDGPQPTSFPPFDYRSFDARRERGVFTVTVPAGFTGDVVWTLRHRGRKFSVPGRAKSSAYQLSYPMAMGSVPPLLRFRRDGPAGRGPSGIQGETIQTGVGVPLPITIWLTDDSVREKQIVTLPRDALPVMHVSWFKHSGPGNVAFDPQQSPVDNTKGEAATLVTFDRPGRYMVRVRADNFGAIDSRHGNQCCWTNGYVPIAVVE